MGTTREQSKMIRDFILNNIEEHPRDITSFAADKFGLTRNAILWHINNLIERDLISANGATKDRYYGLNPISSDTFTTNISDNLEEDQLWLHIIRPNLKKLPDNVLRICEYGLSEMINNAIEHSEGNTLTLKINQYATKATFSVIDDGIGIFRKIQRDCDLNDPRHSILELAKGKLTTDPENHSGEGIFFTSRMFDRFIIISKGLYFSHNEPDEDWLLEHDIEINGTSVQMSIRTNLDREINDIFDAYASDHQDYGFTRTHVPLSLATYGDENLISRSQARRLLSRFRDFSEVLLDFDGVKTIGQAFSDEIFRVFARNNPDVGLVAINTNKQIDKMISRAQKKLRSV